MKMEPPTVNGQKLVTEEGLIKNLFEPDCAPSLRTIRRWRYERIIPYVKIGSMVFFDVEKVRESLARKNIVRAA